MRRQFKTMRDPGLVALSFMGTYFSVNLPKWILSYVPGKNTQQLEEEDTYWLGLRSVAQLE